MVICYGLQVVLVDSIWNNLTAKLAGGEWPMPPWLAQGSKKAPPSSAQARTGLQWLQAARRR